MVNGFAFTRESRTPDPQRLVQAYHAAAATLNLVRAFTQGGFADLRQVHDWNRASSPTRPTRATSGSPGTSTGRCASWRPAAPTSTRCARVEFYAGHEALLLDYERPLTRIDSRTGRPYDVSAHFVWVGERTRDLDGAHVDFVSRIRNPIGVKLGPKADPDDVLRADRQGSTPTASRAG